MSSVQEKNTKGSFTDAFLRVFPTPHFLQTPAVGLDITDSSIRFLEFVKTKHGNKLGRFGNYEVPEGVIEGGKILDKAALTKVLCTMQREHHLEFVNVSLPEEQIYLFQTTVSSKDADKKKLINTLEFKLEENVPISSRDLVFDYEVIGGKSPSGEVNINVAAFPRDLVEDYVEVLREAGMKPRAFEIEAQSVARSVVPEGKKKGVTMIVDFGKVRTGIAIVSDGVLRFTSTVPVGGSTLTTAVQKHFNVSVEEADKIKNKRGFARYKENKELLEVLMTTISVLKDEINKHYVYWNTRVSNHQESEKIGSIIVCGGSANLAGLTEYLTLNLEVEVSVANVWVNALAIDTVVPQIEFRHSLSYATAIGLALRQM